MVVKCVLVWSIKGCQIRHRRLLPSCGRLHGHPFEFRAQTLIHGLGHGRGRQGLAQSRPLGGRRRRDAISTRFAGSSTFPARVLTGPQGRNSVRAGFRLPSFPCTACNRPVPQAGNHVETDHPLPSWADSAVRPVGRDPRHGGARDRPAMGSTPDHFLPSS